MNIKKILCFLSLSLAFGCNGQNKNVESVVVNDFAYRLKINKNPQLIDVRTPEEYQKQHIDNAININWNGNDFDQQIMKLDKSKPVFVYCLSGGRSKQAANKMAESGFTNVVELSGGILKWNAAGNDTPSDKIIGICSQEYKELIKSNPKTLVNFYAEWCAPCKKMAPYITKMQTEMKGTVNIVRLNADENKTIMKELKIEELPVILIYEGDKIVYQHSGYLSEEDLKKQL